MSTTSVETSPQLATIKFLEDQVLLEELGKEYNLILSTVTIIYQIAELSRKVEKNEDQFSNFAEEVEWVKTYNEKLNNLLEELTIDPEKQNIAFATILEMLRQTARPDLIYPVLVKTIVNQYYSKKRAVELGLEISKNLSINIFCDNYHKLLTHFAQEMDFFRQKDTKFNICISKWSEESLAEGPVAIYIALTIGPRVLDAITTIIANTFLVDIFCTHNPDYKDQKNKGKLPTYYRGYGCEAQQLFLSCLAQRGGPLLAVNTDYFAQLKRMRKKKVPPQMNEKYITLYEQTLGIIKEQEARNQLNSSQSSSENEVNSLGGYSKKAIAKLLKDITLIDLYNVVSKYVKIYQTILKTNDEHIKFLNETLKEVNLLDLIKNVHETLQFKPYYPEIIKQLNNIVISKLIFHVIKENLKVNPILSIISQNDEAWDKNEMGQMENRIRDLKWLYYENNPTEKDVVARILIVNRFFQEFLEKKLNQDVSNFPNTKEGLAKEFLEFLIALKSIANDDAREHLLNMSIEFLKSTDNFFNMKSINSAMRFENASIKKEFLNEATRILEFHKKNFFLEAINYLIIIDDVGLKKEFKKLLTLDHSDYKALSLIFSDDQIKHLKEIKLIEDEKIDMSTFKESLIEGLKAQRAELKFTFNKLFSSKLFDPEEYSKDSKIKLFNRKKDVPQNLPQKMNAEMTLKMNAIKTLFSNKAFLFLILVTYYEDCIEQHSDNLSEFLGDKILFVNKVLTRMPIKASALIDENQESKSQEGDVVTDFPGLMSQNAVLTHLTKMTRTSYVESESFSEIYEKMGLALIGKGEASDFSKTNESETPEVYLQKLTGYGGAAPLRLCNLFKALPQGLDISLEDFTTLIKIDFCTNQSSEPSSVSKNNNNDIAPQVKKLDHVNSNNSNQNIPRTNESLSRAALHEKFKKTMLKRINDLNKNIFNFEIAYSNNVTTLENQLDNWKEKQEIDNMLFVYRSDLGVWGKYTIVSQNKYAEKTLHDPNTLKILNMGGTNEIKAKLKPLLEEERIQTLSIHIVALLVAAINENDMELYEKIMAIIFDKDDESITAKIVKQMQIDGKYLINNKLKEAFFSEFSAYIISDDTSSHSSHTDLSNSSPPPPSTSAPFMLSSSNPLPSKGDLPVPSLPETTNLLQLISDNLEPVQRYSSGSPSNSPSSTLSVFPPARPHRDSITMQHHDKSPPEKASLDLNSKVITNRQNSKEDIQEDIQEDDIKKHNKKEKKDKKEKGNENEKKAKKEKKTKNLERQDEHGIGKLWGSLWHKKEDPQAPSSPLTSHKKTLPSNQPL